MVRVSDNFVAIRPEAERLRTVENATHSNALRDTVARLERMVGIAGGAGR